MNIYEDVIDPIGKLTRIETLRPIFNKYKLIYFDSRHKDAEFDPMDKELYLVGDVINAKEIKLKGINIAYEDPFLLLDFLKLGESIDKDWHIYGRNNDELSQESHSGEIINICKKYGLLDISSYLRNEFLRLDNTNIYGFSLRDVKNSLVYLYDSYERWYQLTNFSVRDFKESKYYKDIKTESDIEKKKNNLAHYLERIIIPKSKLDLNIKYNEKKKNFEVVISASSLLDVALFQLKLLIINQNGHYGIDHCKKCGEFFYFNHGNEKHCDNCKLDQGRDDTTNCRKRLEYEAKRYITNKYSNKDIIIDDIFEIEKDYIKSNIGKSTPFNKKKIKDWLSNN